MFHLLISTQAKRLEHTQLPEHRPRRLRLLPNPSDRVQCCQLSLAPEMTCASEICFHCRAIASKSSSGELEVQGENGEIRCIAIVPHSFPICSLTQALTDRRNANRPADRFSSINCGNARISNFVKILLCSASTYCPSWS